MTVHGIEIIYNRVNEQGSILLKVRRETSTIVSKFGSKTFKDINEVMDILNKFDDRDKLVDIYFRCKKFIEEVLSE